MGVARNGVGTSVISDTDGLWPTLGLVAECCGGQRHFLDGVHGAGDVRERPKLVLQVWFASLRGRRLLGTEFRKAHRVDTGRNVVVQ